MSRWAARLTVLTPAAATALLLLAGPRRTDLPTSFGDVPAWLDGDAAVRAAALAGLAAWALTLWLAMAVAATLVADLPGRLGVVAGTVSGRIAPAVLRSTLHAGIGAGLGLTILTTSVAGAGLTMTSAPAAAATRTTSTPGPGTPDGSPAWPDLGRPAGPAPATAPTAAPTTGPSVVWPELERPSAGPTAASVTAPGPPSRSPSTSTSPSTTTAPAPVRTIVTTPSAPTRPTTPDAPTPAPLRAGPLTVDADGGVVVMRGDTLWDLSASWIQARTGQIPTTAEVATAWPAWWQANRSVIGADPAHLLPGQRLVPPAATLTSPPASP